MRVILVGRPPDRARLRAALGSTDFEVGGEAETLAAARASWPGADGFLVAGARGEDGDAPPVEPLTPRELEVLALLSEGRSNKAIGARLGISDQTVKFHVASITGKLGARNRTDAVR